MSGSNRRRTERVGTLRTRLRTGIEALESRQLLTLPPGSYHPYQPSNLAPRVVDGSSPNVYVSHPIGSNPKVLATLGNEGKLVQGTDRQGDQWQITVHGPGSVIVTDATPNDGVLDDDIDTIQIIGADPNNTYVTGQTTASSRVISEGVIRFNHLVSLNGVKSIILNGFTLARTVDVLDTGDTGTTAIANTGDEIYLPGGVGYLQFHNIEAPIDLATTDSPIDIVIGQTNTPLTVAPIIRLDSIFNTVFNSSLGSNPNGVPRTTPTVRIVVNGDLKDLTIISSTAAAIPAGFQYQFPTVGTTGRTSVRATGVGNLKVVGSARNFTLSRSAQPFTNGFSGVSRLHSATFGGNADAVALDVRGNIGKIRALHGLGNPAGSQTGATHYGLPDAERGYPSFGLLGAAVRANKIHGIQAGPANLILQTSNNPDEVMAGRQGMTTFFSRPGVALQSATIAAARSIGHTNIVGNMQNSEIKAGFHYPSYVSGLEGTRARSKIAPFRQRGDNVDAVVSSTYRAGADKVYGNINANGTTDDQAGPGAIRGHFAGRLYTAGGQTSLGNKGRGFFARSKHGYLPPPELPSRIHGQLRV